MDSTPTSPSIPIQLRGGGDERPHLPAPVQCSVPWPMGQLTDDDRVLLRTKDGSAVPLQARVLDRWPDQSVRWSLLTWVTDTNRSTDPYQLTIAPPDTQELSAAPLTGTAGMSQWTASQDLHVNTGRAEFVLSKSGTFPLVSATVSGLEMLADSEFTIEPAKAISLKTISVVEDGPAYTCVDVDGTAGELSVRFLLHFFRDTTLVRLEVSLLNPHAAAHPEGHWPLGAAGRSEFRDCSFTLKPSVRSAVRISTGESNISEAPRARAHLFQASSGGEQWDSSNHVDASGQVPCQFRGYRVVADDEEINGLRATPVISQGADGDGIAVGLTCFWQNFPKVFSASSEDGIRTALWPHEAAVDHELQGGEQKTHEAWLAFGPSARTHVRAALSPVVGQVPCEWVSSSEAIAYLPASLATEDARLTKLRESALDGPHSFAAKREITDEYGWRNFGDLYADHEAVYHESTTPYISHYNNQYDPIWGCLCRFLTSGDVRWFELGLEQTQHVRDIDIYHTTQDRWPYNKGLFWHTNHYVQAGRASHRSFDPDNGPGGGPGAEHLYPSGLKLHYLLTGDTRSRQHVIDFGDYVINSDDGRLQKFWMISSAPTGYMSASGSADYHGPGRGSGNALVALLEAFDLSRERRYLNKAEELIRRCCNPADDLNARDLFNVEKRWYYMVFLHALTRYLDIKRLFGETDATFDYAKQSLLLYVRWAAAHEYPYLDKPELLEFPTETWAAQEMRKSEVFDRATIYANNEERKVFSERATYFFDKCLSYLESSPTAHYTRPTVLLLLYGSARSWFETNGDTLPAPGDGHTNSNHPPPCQFRPQRDIVLRRLKTLVVAAAGTLVLVVGALVS